MSKLVALGLTAIGATLAAKQSRNRYRSQRKKRRRRSNDWHDAVDTQSDVQGDLPSERTASNLEEGEVKSAEAIPFFSPLLLLSHAAITLIIVYVFPWMAYAMEASVLSLAFHIVFVVFLKMLINLQIRRTRRMGRGPSHGKQRKDDTEKCPLVTEAMRDSIRALNGVWLKDKDLSDDMSPVFDLMKMSVMLRTAIGHITGVEINAIPPSDKADDDSDAGDSSSLDRPRESYERGIYSFSVLTGILWFKIREKYILDGLTVVCHKRRDRRRGGAFAIAFPSADGGIEVKTAFGHPLKGTMHERIFSPVEGILHIETTVSTDENGSVSYRQVYRKRVQKNL